MSIFLTLLVLLFKNVCIPTCGDCFSSMVFILQKVSQVMNRAARLNEAFYVVKRLPIIRPSLPAVGVTTWPVASIR